MEATEEVEGLVVRETRGDGPVVARADQVAGPDDLGGEQAARPVAAGHGLAAVDAAAQALRLGEKPSMLLKPIASARAVVSLAGPPHSGSPRRSSSRCSSVRPTSTTSVGSWVARASRATGRATTASRPVGGSAALSGAPTGSGRPRRRRGRLRRRARRRPTRRGWHSETAGGDELALVEHPQRVAGVAMRQEDWAHHRRAQWLAVVEEPVELRVGSGAVRAHDDVPLVA